MEEVAAREQAEGALKAGGREHPALAPVDGLVLGGIWEGLVWPWIKEL